MTTPTRITEEARKLCNGVAKAFQDLDDLDTASAPVAQALLAAEQRGREEEREAADKRIAEYAGRWADRYDAAIRSRTTEG